MTPIPEVYVLWHPRCQLGEVLARRIHGWLRPGSALGPQVYYRCLPAPEAPSAGLPPPLPGETRGMHHAVAIPRVGNFQIVLPLIDANMIADPAWRHWLAQLALPVNSPGQREFMPVALDPTAFNAPEALRERNFLRPTGLVAGPPADSAGQEAVSRSLLKQLTEALCRLMLGKRTAPAAVPAGAAGDGAAAPKVKIFLSHAKADGVGPARRIRDYIYSQTQLAAFYDENDIPFGSAFRRVLERDIQGEETAALIVIRSARYAGRPWCRREVSLFRRPIAETQDPMTAVFWRLNPVVVVEAIADGERTLGLAELGNAPLIRWAEQVPDLEEQVVTTLLRDAALAAFHSAVGRTLPPPQHKHLILNWLPDPTTLLHIPSVRASSQEDLEIFYPGRGLSGLELDILGDFFPNIVFRSFEEVLS